MAMKVNQAGRNAGIHRAILSILLLYQTYHRKSNPSIYLIYSLKRGSLS
jgi:hypothetical protein